MTKGELEAVIKYHKAYRGVGQQIDSEIDSIQHKGHSINTRFNSKDFKIEHFENSDVAHSTQGDKNT